jgi:3-methylfumaryl-CoA hydratase
LIFFQHRACFRAIGDVPVRKDDAMNVMTATMPQGDTATEIGGVSQMQAAQIHAVLGTPRSAAPVSGDLLPPLWHWAAFPPTAPMCDLGPDGHPVSAGILPPAGQTRRMWAGGALRFAAPLRIGEPLERRSRIRSVTRKDGKSGPMTVMTVDHAIYGAAGLAVEERQDIVYLPMPESYAPPRKLPMPERPVLRHVAPMSETLLFRFSAITFNAHRIHYDQAYATQVEHYPGLVVHGPLQALLLCDAARRHVGRAPAQFDYRGVHPMFHQEALDIVGTDGEDGELLLFTGQGGHQGMQASATWEGTV